MKSFVQGFVEGFEQSVSGRATINRNYLLCWCHGDKNDLACFETADIGKCGRVEEEFQTQETVAKKASEFISEGRNFINMNRTI